MISIISPVYRCAPYICRCLDSLKVQTYQDFEVLLVDDHGGDDSVEIARRHVMGDSRFRFLRTPRNAGPGVARNIGIEAAKGEYIAFIDSDDVWEPIFLERLLGATRGLYDLAYCQLRYEGGGRDGQVHRNPVVREGAFDVRQKRLFLRRFVTFSVCFLFRREFLLRHRLRFPARRNSEDTNFLTRCLLLAQSIACVDEPLYVYCLHADSLTTGRDPAKWRERLEAMRTLMSQFEAMKQDPCNASLELDRYDGVLRFIWFKKGLVQALRDWVLYRI